ncbi:hypothetical protein F3J44_06405 [Pantoea sp. Tr-811]|uniref:hypothetical protein n=1 Tax=unclassified Pantoea TaxID=2630326 RepID=UPI001420ADCF|nr:MULTISPECIES: hypothetical protein [unclassified Pantoea]NIE74889.1 hypothetical protein [Pantoea sp. Ap-967]NIF26015.1 hypothetical protein [Pantoea sp. Tr-811]
MKTPVWMLLLLLSGCTNGDFFLLPSQQDLKFACDMDPYKQGCERRSDYDRHFKSVEGKKG